MATLSWIEESFVSNNITTHYYYSHTTGIDTPYSLLQSSLPILIFLHGILSNSGSLQPAAVEFTKEYRVVLPDARCHAGTKPTPIGSFTHENLVQDVVSLIRHVSPNRQVYVMGFGMGATTAAKVAKNYPELVQGVLLENPPWGGLITERIYLPAGGFPMQDKPYPGQPYRSNCLSLTTKQSLQMMENVAILQNKTQAQFMEYAQGRNLSQLEMGELEAMISFDYAPCKGTFAELVAQNCEAVTGITVPIRMQIANSSSWAPGFQVAYDFAKMVAGTWTRGSIAYFKEGKNALHVPPTQNAWVKDVLNFLRAVESKPGRM